MYALSNIVEIIVNNDNFNDFLFEYLKLINSNLNIASLAYYTLDDQTFIKKLSLGAEDFSANTIKKEETLTLFSESKIVKLNIFPPINVLYHQCITYASMVTTEDGLHGLILIGANIKSEQHPSFFQNIITYLQPVNNIHLNYKDYRQSIINMCMNINSPVLRSISHDIRNPIQMISILVEMLKAKELTQEKRLVLHTKLTNGISQIDKITTDVSELFKRDHDINISKVSCPVFFKDISTEAISLLQKSKIDFELNLEYKSTIEIDAEKIKDIIIKMVKYSAELIPDSGLIALSVEEQGDDIKILIIDTSVGIETKILQNQKNPFFNFKGRLGTGLNFAIMHSVIETHSGKLNIYNQKDGGSVFDITIPKKNKFIAQKK